jgi:hypothetical protein
VCNGNEITQHLVKGIADLLFELQLSMGTLNRQQEVAGNVLISQAKKQFSRLKKSKLWDEIVGSSAKKFLLGFPQVFTLREAAHGQFFVTLASTDRYPPQLQRNAQGQAQLGSVHTVVLGGSQADSEAKSKSRRNQTMTCTACNKKKKNNYFSATQRAKPSDQRRCTQCVEEAKTAHGADRLIQRAQRAATATGSWVPAHVQDAVAAAISREEYNSL